MIVLYILGGLIGFCLLLMMVPVTFTARLNGDFSLRLRYGLIPVFRLPGKEKPEKKPKKVKKSKKVKKERKAKKAKRKLIDIGRMLKEDGVGATLAYFRQLASLVKKSGGRMLSAVRVGRLEMQLVIASEDAAKTAITYGKYCGAFYSALAVVKQVIPIKRRRVSMIPDFFNEKGSATLYLRGHVIPLRLLFEALRFLIAFLLFNTKKQKETVKDGQ